MILFIRYCGNWFFVIVEANFTKPLWMPCQLLLILNHNVLSVRVFISPILKEYAVKLEKFESSSVYVVF